MTLPYFSIADQWTFQYSWWATSRTCAMLVRYVRRKDNCWLTETTAPFRKCLQQRTTWRYLISSQSSSVMWWRTLSTVQTADDTVAPSQWPNSSIMSLVKGGSLSDGGNQWLLIIMSVCLNTAGILYWSTNMWTHCTERYNILVLDKVNDMSLFKLTLHNLISCMPQHHNQEHPFQTK